MNSVIAFVWCLHWIWPDTQAARPPPGHEQGGIPLLHQERFPSAAGLRSPAQHHRRRGFSAAQREGIVSNIPAASLRKEDTEWEVTRFKSVTSKHKVSSRKGR